MISRHEYLVSIDLSHAPFYALIMAAMRNADTYNLQRLKAAFPDTYAEFSLRYYSPGGELEGEHVKPLADRIFDPEHMATMDAWADAVLRRAADAE